MGKNDLHHGAHTTWRCQYHLVFAPKFRRKAIYGELRADIGKILRKLCDEKKVEIIEAETCIDHVHMLVSIPPKISVSSYMGYPKSKSSQIVFDNHAYQNYNYDNRKFWAEGCFVSTDGLNEVTIRNYISQQKKHDIMRDKLSTREYEKTFKGQPK